MDESAGNLLDGLRAELGARGMGLGANHPPTSPVKRAEARSGREKTKKRNAADHSDTNDKSKKSKTTIAEDVNTVEETRETNKKKANSDYYSEDERPPIFKNDEKFNLLSFDKTAKICYSWFETKERKKEKELKNNSIEKSDDDIIKVMIPAGEDDAGDVINKEARKLMRPINKEIGQIMSWYQYKRTEVIRNLPLALYGLQDTVSTRAVELAHNLANTIEIKMFSPNNLRTSVTSKRQTASTDKSGKLVVESEDMYGELESTMDVMLAWNTLTSIWQKIFPDWPVAVIGSRVCLNMKMFTHCGNKSRVVMISFSNR